MSHTSYIGTNDYISPEVKQGGKYTEKADIYSLCVMMNKDFKLLSIDKFLSHELNDLTKLKNLFIDNDSKNRPKLDKILNIINNCYFDKFMYLPKYIVSGFINCESNNYPDEIINTLKIIEQHSSHW